VISSHFQDETIAQMGGIAQLNPADQELIGPAIQLIRDDRARGFRIDIESDSMVMLDETNERQARVEFLSAVGTFLKESMAAIQTMPAMGPLLGELLMFGIRGFKVGRTIEGVFEKTMAQLQQTPPQQPGAQQAAEAQAKQQADQNRLQMDQAKLELQTQKDNHQRSMDQAKLMMERQRDNQGMQLEAARIALDRDKAEMDFRAGGER
jgi:hypothetical protein